MEKFESEKYYILRRNSSGNFFVRKIVQKFFMELTGYFFRVVSSRLLTRVLGQKNFRRIYSRSYAKFSTNKEIFAEIRQRYQAEISEEFLLGISLSKLQNQKYFSKN